MSPLASLGSTIQDLNRLREILVILTRYGFGYVIDQMQLQPYLPAKGRMTRVCDLKASVPVRVRQMLDELGPTFVKLGQVLSMRPDLLPAEYIHELTKLQDRVAPFTDPTPESIVKEELGKPISELFKSFEKTPLAAASIAQVHRAITKNNQQVVIKIQRPGIKRKVESDLEILRFLANTWQNFHKTELPRHPVEFVDEFENMIHEELDFMTEARHLERFSKNFSKRPDYCFAKVYWELSTPRCLTLEYIEGQKLTELPKHLPKTQKNTLAQLLFDAYIHMTLEDRFFHADPHGGNFIYTSAHKLAFLDAGQVGRLDTETVAAFTDMLLALVKQDTDGLVEAYLHLGTTDESVDRRQLKRDTAIFLERYYDLPIEQISFGQALQDLLGLAVKYQINMPSDFVILAKTFMGVESLARELNPKLNLIQAAQPTAEAIMWKRFEPEQMTTRFFRQFKEFGRFVRDLPGQLQELLSKLQHGRLKLEFEHVGLEELQHSIDRASNRLSFSLVVAALIVGSSFVLVSQVGPKWGGVSILGLVGFVLAGFFGFLLIIAIIRSGKM